MIRVLAQSDSQCDLQTWPAAIEGEAGTRQQLTRRRCVSDPQPFIDSNTAECVLFIGRPQEFSHPAFEELVSTKGRYTGHTEPVDKLRTRQRCVFARSPLCPEAEHRSAETGKYVRALLIIIETLLMTGCEDARPQYGAPVQQPKHQFCTNQYIQAASPAHTKEHLRYSCYRNAPSEGCTEQRKQKRQWQGGRGWSHHHQRTGSPTFLYQKDSPFPILLYSLTLSRIAKPLQA